MLDWEEGGEQEWGNMFTLCWQRGREKQPSAVRHKSIQLCASGWMFYV